MNKSTRENDGKYCEWVTRDTRNKIVVKAAMVSLIISHDGAVHRVTVISLNDYSPYQGPSGADDTERAQVHCCDRREVLQQRQLGVRCIEEGTPWYNWIWSWLFLWKILNGRGEKSVAAVWQHPWGRLVCAALGHATSTCRSSYIYEKEKTQSRENTGLSVNKNDHLDCMDMFAKVDNHHWKRRVEIGIGSWESGNVS